MKKNIITLLCFFSFVSLLGQKKSITGFILDEKGSPLPFVTATIKGTNTGGLTDLSGKFSLTASVGDVIEISYIGYKTQTITIDERTEYRIRLESDVALLDKVVVVGYGTQKRKSTTGAISQINTADLVTTGVSSFDVALQGKAAGLQVTGSSGIAGSVGRIRIRGTNSINASGEPLYVVDGVPLATNYVDRIAGSDVNPLANINPNDIASIEILKDAGSAGIYGSRGANGVILITTKSAGAKEKLSFNVSTSSGISLPTYKPDLLNSSELVQILQEGWENDGGQGPVPLPGFNVTENSSIEDRQAAINKALQTNTDWWDAMTRIGFKQNYNISAQQRLKKLSYYGGISFDDNKSYVKVSRYNKISGRLNIDYNPVKGLKIGGKGSISYGKNNIAQSSHNGGIGNAMTTALPFYPTTNMDGSYYRSFNGVRSGSDQNPYTYSKLLDWTTYEIRTINNISLSYTPGYIPDLVLSANFGIDYKDFNQQKYEPALLLNTKDHIGTAEEWRNYTTNLVGGVNATYWWNINDNNRVNILLGSEVQTTKNSYTSRKQSDVDGQLINSPGSGDNLVNGNPYELEVRPTTYDQTAFLSFFSRINYTLKERYIFQLIFRTDGASQFGTNNKFGFFPAVSGAWRISEESFMKQSSVISNLKLRASWGITGNANIPSNQWRGTYSPPQYGYNGRPYFYAENRENPNLRWESLYNTDVGIEFGLWKNRITGDLSYYYKLSTDILINRNDLPSGGFGNYWDNIGKISNQGVELSLTSENLKINGFSWSTTLNMARNVNRVEDIGGISPDAFGGNTNDTRIVVGQPVGINYLVRFSRVDPTDGLPIWLDKDGYETKVYNNNRDRVVVGSTQPDFLGGFENTFTFKGLTLSVYFTFSVGGNIYDGSGKRQSTIFTSWNLYKHQLADRWRKPGDIAGHPRVTLDPHTYPGLASEWQYNSTLFLYDASYLRFKTLSLGYTFSTAWMKQWRISSLRLDVTATNLFTWTEYPGDPELNRDAEGNAGNRNFSSGINYLTVPQEKSFIIGLKIGF